MCLVFVTALFFPRVAFALLWIFGDRVELAFSSWLWPALLLAFLPWTGILYTLLWSPSTGVEDAEWVLVAIAVVVDILSWSSRVGSKGYRYT
jgi:hypothetical protein